MLVYIFIRVCALVYNGVLPLIFARHRGHQYLPQMAEIFSHLRRDAATTKQRHAARPRSLGPHGVQTGQSALISANRRVPGVPERACGADATLVETPGHGLGVWCKTIHIAGFGAGQFRSSAMSRRM